MSRAQPLLASATSTPLAARSSTSLAYSSSLDSSLQHSHKKNNKSDAALSTEQQQRNSSALATEQAYVEVNHAMFRFTYTKRQLRVRVAACAVVTILAGVLVYLLFPRYPTFDFRDLKVVKFVDAADGHFHVTMKVRACVANDNYVIARLDYLTLGVRHEKDALGSTRVDAVDVEPRHEWCEWLSLSASLTHEAVQRMHDNDAPPAPPPSKGNPGNHIFVDFRAMSQVHGLFDYRKLVVTCRRRVLVRWSSFPTAPRPTFSDVTAAATCAAVIVANGPGERHVEQAMPPTRTSTKAVTGLTTTRS
jgi:hypothetical protein